MSSRRLQLGIGMDAVRAATKKMAKLDQETTVAIAEARSVRIRRREQLGQRTDAIRRATDKYATLDDGDQPEHGGARAAASDAACAHALVVLARRLAEDQDASDG